jgi:hypothetical protein
MWEGNIDDGDIARIAVQIAEAMDKCVYALGTETLRVLDGYLSKRMTAEEGMAQLAEVAAAQDKVASKALDDLTALGASVALRLPADSPQRELIAGLTHRLMASVDNLKAQKRGQ